VSNSYWRRLTLWGQQSLFAKVLGRFPTHILMCIAEQAILGRFPTHILMYVAEQASWLRLVDSGVRKSSCTSRNKLAGCGLSTVVCATAITLIFLLEFFWQHELQNLKSQLYLATWTTWQLNMNNFYKSAPAHSALSPAQLNMNNFYESAPTHYSLRGGVKPPSWSEPPGDGRENPTTISRSVCKYFMSISVTVYR